LFGLRDYEELGVRGEAKHVVPSSAPSPHKANEGFLVYDTTVQESTGNDEPEKLHEELLGKGHR